MLCTISLFLKLSTRGWCQKVPGVITHHIVAANVYFLRHKYAKRSENVILSNFFFFRIFFHVVPNRTCRRRWQNVGKDHLHA